MNKSVSEARAPDFYDYELIRCPLLPAKASLFTFAGPTTRHLPVTAIG